MVPSSVICDRVKALDRYGNTGSCEIVACDNVWKVGDEACDVALQVVSVEFVALRIPRELVALRIPRELVALKVPRELVALKVLRELVVLMVPPELVAPLAIEAGYLRMLLKVRHTHTHN